MNNKLIFGILIAAMFAISAASAQWVDLSGSGLDSGDIIQKGAEDNSFTYSSGTVVSYFEREGALDGANWNAWLYPLETTVTQANSFFLKFKITTPTNYDLIENPPASGTPAFAMFGVYNSAAPSQFQNGVYLDIQWATDYSPEIYLIIGSAQSGNLAGGYQALPNTELTITLSYDSTTNTVTAKIYETGILAKTVSYSSAAAFSADSVGLAGELMPSDTRSSIYTNSWQLTSIKANSGTEEATVVDAALGHPECGGICSINGYASIPAFPAYFWDTANNRCVADPAGAALCSVLYIDKGGKPTSLAVTAGNDSEHPENLLVGVDNWEGVIDVDAPLMGDIDNYHLYVIIPWDNQISGHCRVHVDNDLNSNVDLNGDLMNGKCITDVGSYLTVNGGSNPAPALIGGTLPSGTNPDEIVVTIPTDNANDNGPAVSIESSPTGSTRTSTAKTLYGLTISALSGSDTIYTVSGETSSTTTKRTFYTGDNFYVGASTPVFKVDMSSLTGAQSLNWNTLSVTQGSSGAPAFDSGAGLTVAKKDLYVSSGTLPYAYCCPSATTANAVNITCSGMFVTYTKKTIDSADYFVCAGMSGSGGAANGETNLTINDSAEGGSVATGAQVEYYAYFYNATTGIGDTSLNDTNANCTVYEDGANQTMTYSSGNTRWEANDADGYATSGTKRWDVWCYTNATGHFNLTANDTVDVTSGTSYPEFSDFAWVLAAVLGAGGFVLMRRMKKF